MKRNIQQNQVRMAAHGRNRTQSVMDYGEKYKASLIQPEQKDWQPKKSSVRQKQKALNLSMI